jgi:5-methylcytosine-specific restriction endonuclease McrA
MFSGKLEVLVQYDEVIAHIDSQTLKTFPDLQRSLRQVLGSLAESFDIKVPAVTVIRRNIGAYKSDVKYGKKNVCLRDNFTCQYCGKQFPMSQLNQDHVLPRSRGGKTVWTNIVMACYACNERKADRTPDEAGMPLMSVPVKPKILPMGEPLIDVDRAPEEWLPYLSGQSKCS